MTPTGRNAIIAGTLVVFVTAGILIKGFVSLNSDSSARRHHHRRAEEPRGPISSIQHALESKSRPGGRSQHSSSETSNDAPEAHQRGERGVGTSDPPVSPPVGQGNDFVLSEQTPETAAIQRAVQEKLEGAVFRNPGNGVAFVDCTQKPCRARAEAKDMVALTAFLKDLSGTYDGHVAAELRERLDPFMGRSFQADLLVGTKDTQPVLTEPSTFE